MKWHKLSEEPIPEILFRTSSAIVIKRKDGAPEDKTPAVEVCNQACNADTETCVCKDADAGNHVCACEAKATEECKCDDGSDCPEGGKDACQKDDKPTE
jgi:hypothetical protein